MKQTLQLKLSQHLALTPQLQQSIRLLQLSTLELNQEIDNFLQDNPLLEREDEPAPEAPLYAASGDALQAPSEQPEGALPEPNFGDNGPADWLGESGPSSRDERNDDEPSYAEIQAAATSLRDHLGAQLAMMPLSERDRSLVRLLIEALDDDGYLAQSLEELAEMLPPELEVDLDELQIALKHLQNFDPPGIGARNASECLALQLANLPQSKTRDLALAIVRNHLDQLAARDYVRLRKAVACSEDELREAQSLIRSLNPRPGAQYSPSETRYVVPDVVVRKLRGQWLASLNAEAMPRLRINRLYADILQGQRGSGLASQLQEAKWLIKNVQQRFETIQRVSQAIVDRQRQFFEHGEVAMRPLTLREIADQLGLHESTISRVTTQKYMASPRGVFELKYFFGSHVATEAGGAASSTAIRALIKQLVGAEDGKKPLSDAQLAEILGQQGIVVARRTVAKYREALNIPPVNLRKSI
ncbi:MAG: RNA polymerase factor sigma-54 [Rhodocyclaceae bacterium]|jgi:RNA polymerase sigma-54 factor|nr:RNA polymerase factor sigma-54 [Rhodocyclaceae bacterium]